MPGSLGRLDVPLTNRIPAPAPRRELQMTRPRDRRQQRLWLGEVAVQDRDRRVQHTPRADRITSQHANGSALLVQEPGNQKSRSAGMPITRTGCWARIRASEQTCWY